MVVGEVTRRFALPVVLSVKPFSCGPVHCADIWRAQAEGRSLRSKSDTAKKLLVP